MNFSNERKTYEKMKMKTNFPLFSFFFKNNGHKEVNKDQFFSHLK